MADIPSRVPKPDDLIATGPYNAAQSAGANDLPRIPFCSSEAAGTRFQLGEEIARGGMGAIFRAVDCSLERDLAVKIMLRDPADNPDGARRFHEEARITGQLQHPGIVPIHEIGTLSDGRPFFAMKLIQGESLAKRLGERPSAAQDQAQFLKVFEQVCQAVAYAHSQGVIHRDLKPLNVMVGAFGEVQVMDWGLAKHLSQRAEPVRNREATNAEVAESDPDATVDRQNTADNKGMTRAGDILGTPAYMPPEQARGDIDLIDERADVFGLGAILCEILTGQPPYTGKRGEVLAKAAAADLAEAYQRLEASGADPQLIALTRRCLAPNLGARFRNAGEVAAAVAAHQAGVQEQLRQAELERAAAQVRESEAQARARVERKARQRAVGLAAAALLLVIGGGTAGFLLYRQAAEKAAENVRQRGEAQVAVGAALDQVETWLKEGRLRETEAALVQADKRLADAEQDELQQRFASLRKDLQMLVALEQIYTSHFGKEKPVAAYRRAFEDYGLLVGKTDTATIVERIKSSVIRDRLIDGLDGWLWGWLEHDTAAVRDALLGILREVDDDDLRNKIREALVRGDAARLRELVNNAMATVGDLGNNSLPSLQ